MDKTSLLERNTLEFLRSLKIIFHSSCSFAVKTAKRISVLQSNYYISLAFYKRNPLFEPLQMASFRFVAMTYS